MLSKAKDFLRRGIRGMQRGGLYPLLLPHHRLTQAGLITVNGDAILLSAGLKKALSLCDGRRTLREAARQSGVSKSEIIKAQDDGLVIIWRSPVPAAGAQMQHHPHS